MTRFALFCLIALPLLLTIPATVSAQQTDPTPERTDETGEERRRMRAERDNADTREGRRTERRDQAGERDPERLADRENQRTIREAIQALPEDQRAAFMEKMRALHAERQAFLDAWQDRYDALVSELPGITPTPSEPRSDRQRQERDRSEREPRERSRDDQ